MFKDYLKYKIISVAVFVMFIAVYFLVGMLYNMRIDGVLYSMLLCTFIGVVAFIIGFFRFSSHVKSLKDFEKNVDLNLDNMPEPIDALEVKYQDLLKLFTDDKKEMINSQDKKLTDMLDYYTMWVHQIKTPISAITLMVNQLEEEERKPLELELFKIDDYVDMVLQYLRCTGKSDYVIRKVNLDLVIRESLKKLASLFINKKIKLQYETLNMNCITDEKWLMFVIVQILTNAIKYTHSQGSIKIYEDTSEKGVLVIEDSGIGISKEDIPRVCEKGFTGCNGRVYKKSTGIGMYLCKMILDKLGHRIEIESEVGVGTKVKIWLPEKTITFE